MIRSLTLLLAGLSADTGSVPLYVSSLSTSLDGALETQNHLFDEPRRVCVDSGCAAASTGPAAQRLPSTAGFLCVNQAPEGDMPRELAFSMDGSEVLTVQRDTDNLTFHDALTRRPTFTVPVGDFPVAVAVTPDNRYALVPNVLDHSLSVIDMALHAVVATVPLTGEQPFALQVLPDSRFVLVALINDAVTSSVSVVDLQSFTETRTFPTGPQGALGFFYSPESAIFGNLFTDFELSPDGTRLVLADRPGSRVRVYDVASGGVLADLVVADVPGDVAISADGLFAVIEHGSDSRQVTLIDLMAMTVAGAFTTSGDLPARCIRITPDGTHAIVGGEGVVHFVDLVSGLTSATLATGAVGDIELSHDGLYAFVGSVSGPLIEIATRSVVATFSTRGTFELAVSPVDNSAVGLGNRLSEDLHFYDIDGPGGAFLEAVVAGQSAEADAPRSLCVSPDGSTLLVVNNTSDNVAVIDVATGTVRAYIPTGRRSLEAAISLDGTRAVVTNGDADTVTLIDLTTDTVEHTFQVPLRPAEVEIAPDGSMAYVTTVAGTDQLWFLDLNTPANSSSLPAGQMGAAFYTYNVFSGMALSDDGSTLAVCISFDDELLLVDTASRSVIQRVSVGSFPLRVAFSPAGDRAYVTNAFSDNLHVLQLSGGSASVLGIVDGIGSPLQVDVDDTDSYAYVGSWDFGSAAVHVVDTGSLACVAEVALGSSPRSSVLDGSDLWVTMTDGELGLIRAEGSASMLVGTTALSGSPSDMVLAKPFGVLYAAQPGVEDGLDVVAASIPVNYCVAAPNSVGAGASMSYSGTTSVSNNDFVVAAEGMPPGVPLVAFYGSTAVQFAFGNGLRCVGGVVQRLYPVVHATSSGTTSRALDFTTSPVGFGPKSIHPGDTWQFQVWYRDGMGGGAGFNLTDGLQATFIP
ncbi:MAG: YVTN family beta-propeller protein [Chlamydiales bacterium]|jgi:YVTN family beta-propeller protein